uniref:5'-nucleotidase SurE n=1 Tax=candidate division WOR-3 bacterium TaxID=2052148 RepID=A0A7V5XZ53_UNCW3
MKRILLTNDDGINAPSLNYLYETLKDLGEVYVCATTEDRSAASHSFTLRKPIEICELKKNWYGVFGTPTDAVLLAYHALLNKKIDILISGINDSPNLGEDVLYSGTVACAIEGTILGIPSFAISFVENNKNLEIALKLVYNLTKNILKYGLPKKTFLNINIPNKEIKGIKITKLGKRIYKDMALAVPNKKMCYLIDGEMSFVNIKGTDFNAVENGYISITPLHLDMTNYKVIKKLEKRFKKII